MEHHRVAFLNRCADLAVDGEKKTLVRSMRKDADHAGLGNDHGTISQHVRADGRDADRGNGRKDDPAPPADNEYAVWSPWAWR